MVEKRSDCRGFCRKSEGRPECRREDGIKMDLKEIGLKGVGRIHVTKDRDQ
jgi:hypothetical protein